MENDENLIDAVKREIFEESGWFPKDKVLDLVKSPAIAERYRAYLEYTHRPVYLEYVSRPKFVLNAKRFL